MRSFDENQPGDSRHEAASKRARDEPVTLEGEIIGDSIRVAAPEPEPVWGSGAARLGRRLLVSAAVLAGIAILIPLTLVVVAAVAVLAVVGRLLLGRPGMVTRWMRAPRRNR